MKGVFIRGMKMPKSCLYCEFRKKIDQDNFRCKILGYPIDWRPCYIQERYTDCLLIEVEIDTDNNVGTTDVPDINVGDMISRQAAIDALRTCYDTETISMDNGDEFINYGDAVGEIEQLPPIQHEPHWIPVTERLPGIGEPVLDDCFSLNWMSYRSGGKEWVFPRDVRAWMPLPEAYKKEF